MKVETIRKLDNYLGFILCFILTLIYKLYCLFYKNKDFKPSIKKIMFLKLTEQGAIVLTIPAIEKAKEIVKSYDNIYFCSFKSNLPILEIATQIPSKNLFLINDETLLYFIIDIIKLAYYTRKNQIDAIIDLEFFSRASAIISFLSGAKIRVGHHRYTSKYTYRGDLFTHKIQYNSYLHTSITYYLLVDCLLEDKNNIPLPKKDISSIKLNIPKLIISQKEKNEITNLIEKELKAKIKKPIIILNPNASDMIPLRKWDEKNFIKLAKLLINQYKALTLILTGQKNEKEKIENLKKQINSEMIISLAGKTTLKQLIALYSISDLLITNDSGPSHFSSLTKIKSIVLFGPETPILFGPLTENATIIWKKFACSPCVNVFNNRFSKCKNNECMQRIEVNEVFEKVKKILK